MKNLVDGYTREEMDKVLEYLTKELDLEGTEGFVAHEISSKYVHTDVLIQKGNDGCLCFATFGMGSREMNAPKGEPTRAELVLISGDIQDEKTKLLIANELTALSKYPFENDTWFGIGHTALASDEFKNSFGYDAFLFVPVSFGEELELGEKKIKYYYLVPIYIEEREAMINGNSIDFLLGYLEKYEGIVPLDEKREIIK